MEELSKYIDRCVESVVHYDLMHDDAALRRRVHFALGYMDDSKEIKKLLWAIAYGEKLEEN